MIYLEFALLSLYSFYFIFLRDILIVVPFFIAPIRLPFLLSIRYFGKILWDVVFGSNFGEQLWGTITGNNFCAFAEILTNNYFEK